LPRQERDWLAEKLLNEDEIERLIKILEAIDSDNLIKKIEKAVREGKVDPREEMATLKRLEILTRDLRRYICSFEYSLETEERKPLNYTTCFYCEKKERRKHQTGAVQTNNQVLLCSTPD